MLEEIEVGAIGVRHVITWLRQNRHIDIKPDTSSPGSTDIETDRALVHVKSVVTPNEPAEPTPDEISSIRSRASELKKDALIAKVVINQYGSLSRAIKVSKL